MLAGTIADRIGGTLGRLLFLSVVLVLAGTGVYAIVDAVVSDTLPPESPGFIDSVLNSDAVVAAIRLALIFAAVYVVASVVALISRRQWLARVGPVHVSEQVSDLVEENAGLRTDLEVTAGIINDLDEELANADRALADLLGRISGPRQRDS